MKKLIFVLPLLLLFGYCKKNNITELEQITTIFGKVSLLSVLTDNFNNTLGDSAMVINGVKVTLQDENINETVSSTITNDLGEYTFSDIKLGYYSVKAVIELDTIKIGSNKSESFQLSIAGMNYPVELLSIPSGGYLSDSNVVYYPPYPNPGTVITIRFFTDRVFDVKIIIFNDKGELVRNLWEYTIIPGYYSIMWDSLDNNEKTVKSGIYYVLVYDGNECLYYQSVLKQLI